MRSSKRRVAVLVAVIVLAATAAAIQLNGQAGASNQGGPTAGTAVVTGMVTATKPFKAAHVYLYNLDKHVMYMVYTSAGAFRAVALFPGNYEVTVRGRGLESPPQKIVVKAGDNPALKVAMSPASSRLVSWVGKMYGLSRSVA